MDCADVWRWRIGNLPRGHGHREKRDDAAHARAPLGVVSFGLAVGVTWALGVFVLGLAAGLFDWGVPVVEILSSLYIGYSPTFVGSVVGAVWGFVDGSIGGALVAWLYNRFLARGAGPTRAAGEESAPTPSG